MNRIYGYMTALTAVASLISGAATACASSRNTPGGNNKEAVQTGVITILGPTEVSAERMWEFVSSVNPAFTREIAEAFYTVGRRYGIRGDVALCQAVLETGWFRFSGGTAVTPDQHNYCGLGVTQLGMKGHKFKSVEEGVTAHIQHLYAYATRKPLPKGEKMIDPRFGLVPRGVASSWTDLNRRWAANDHYGESILAIFSHLLKNEPPVKTEIESEIIELGIPDEYF